MSTQFPHAPTKPVEAWTREQVDRMITWHCEHVKRNPCEPDPGFVKRRKDQ